MGQHFKVTKPNQIAYWTKNNCYICLPYDFVWDSFESIIQNEKNNFLYDCGDSSQLLTNIELNWQFTKYLANESFNPLQDLKNFEKFELELIRKIEISGDNQKNLTNFEIQNTSDSKFEKTIFSLLKVANLFEENLQVLAQNEIGGDVTFFLEWKNSFFAEKLLKEVTPKIVFRLKDIHKVQIRDGSLIEIDSIGRKIDFSFNNLIKLKR
jgi:hypothetical protein